MKRKNITKLVQIFSLLLLLRDLVIFYKKNKKTIQMLVANVDKLLKRRKRV